MLYTESWQGGKKGSSALIVVALSSFLLLSTGCTETPTLHHGNLSLDSYAELKTDEYALNSLAVKENLEHICKDDHDGSYAAKQAKRYYSKGASLLWVDYQGVDDRADTLVSVLREKLPEIGFSEQAFQINQIVEDLETMRSLSFNSSSPASLVASRLDYNLTKAYLRYVAGQRFGFVNPNHVLNHYDVSARDITGNPTAYRHLFDVGMEHPTDAYPGQALRRVTHDSLNIYLRRVEPTNSFYGQLKKMIPTASSAMRQKILVNMERCRWREKLIPAQGEKYIIVNVPAYHLWAVGPDSVLDMRVACGAVKTKTPLLSSRITHMEVNPEWVIPHSIVLDDVARHGGDSSYFARHRYYIADRKTGKHLSPKAVTPAMLRSGNYRVAQEGGAGNSLGRIIFRFPNNFSVFLHDTSSPGAFGRDNRGVSHGCVRVQRPFDLAVFMMEKDPDEWLLDKLRISMGMKPETDRGRELLDELDPGEPTPKLVRYQQVSPRVPIIITYYTIFRAPDGTLQYYPDVYGYDKAIGEAMKTYCS